jgi:hypothetical protein
MSKPRHFTRRAAFLAALAPNDRERVAAEAHAIGCAACRVALDEGNLLFSLLRLALAGDGGGEGGEEGEGEGGKESEGEAALASALRRPGRVGSRRVDGRPHGRVDEPQAEARRTIVKLLKRA